MKLTSLFNEAPKALLEQVERVTRLIRSKGVGIYYITQNPRDVPNNVSAQLGNRIQHAMRAFTPVEQRAVRAAAETFRPNPQLDLERVVQELTVGEALVSVLQGQGEPSVTQRTRIRPPSARIGPLTRAERRTKIETSPLYSKYENAIDRESAYEMLQKRTATADEPEATWGGTVRAGRSSSSNSLLRSLTGSLGRAIGKKSPKEQ